MSLTPHTVDTKMARLQKILQRETIGLASFTFCIKFAIEPILKKSLVVGPKNNLKVVHDFYYAGF